MKLAYSSLPCDGWSIDKHIAVCKEHGFNGIELREGPEGLIFLGMELEKARAVGEAFRKAEIAVTDLGTGVCFLGARDEEPQMEHLRTAILLAEAVGAIGVRVFLGNFAARFNTPLQPLDEANMVLLLREACDTAAAHGREIWLETHNEYAMGRVLRPLLDEVGRGNFKVIYDILHPLEDGESFADTIRLLGKDCAHVHMKDGVRSEDPLDHDWTYTVFGEGEAPIQSILQALEEAGYDGFYSLEWETKWRKELQVPGMEPEVIFPEYTKRMNAYEGRRRTS
ncbi:hypothetical protein SY83_00515 [Paenibacillus swuensis]|uniref:Xylose isomerase-like TIM barrel domain-containing protein n=1 Tax=Paenibacillus swuensis TaxID=1178515 RepID=A0A172TDR7_9BACL|nr:sugar phosphate isomerase/epimerase [Paenibacillus swuensis]ANE45092.1 hypothetical protein SY83_00515 [Paenibacillus swuensis]